MKKVKFTLGLMLAILFIGANVSAQSTVLEPENTKKKYDSSHDNHRITMSLFVNPSSSYANSKKAADFVPGTDENDAIRAGVAGFYASPVPITIGDDVDIRKNASLYDEANSAYLEYGYRYLDSLLALTVNRRVVQYAEVDLLFSDGKEIIPFIERTIVLGAWKYDPEKDINVWVPSGILVTDKLNEVWKKDKTQFTDGSGIATYRFESELLELYRKYPIYSISYELWTNDETNTPYDKNYGEGGAYPSTNRPLVIDADAGITTSISELDLFESRKDVTFTVYAEPGKDLEISTNSQYWTIANGGLKVVSKGSGLWEVTLVKLNAKITIKIAYVPEPESATGNGNITEDKVWGAGGTLYIQSAGEGQLSVYSITGQLVKSAVISGDYSATLPKGLYIVKLNNKAYKAIL